MVRTFSQLAKHIVLWNCLFKNDTQKTTQNEKLDFVHTFDVSSWATRDEKKCTPCTPEPLCLATALKPNTFKIMIYEFFWLFGVFPCCFLGDSYDSVNPVWRNILKKNIASAIHMSKNQWFLDVWAYIGLRALILIIAFWEILFESDEKNARRIHQSHYF